MKTRRQHKLEKHPNGQYRIRIRRDGVSKSFFLGRNKKDAEKKAERIERDVANEKIAFAVQETTAVINPDGAKDMRIEELAVRHLEWVKANRAEGTFNNRQLFLLLFLDFIGPIMVSDITRMHLEQFHSAEKERGSKPNSGNQALRHVKTMLLWGEEMELIDLPFRRFPKVRHVPPETKRVDEADLVLLLDHLPDDFKDMILFGLMTGLRPNELRELTQGQVRQSGNGTAYVYIARHKTARTIGEPKPRTVPLCSQAKEIFERQVKSHPKSDHIFLNDDGTPYDRTVFRNRLIRWCRRAGIKDITPYALRHTFASMESDAGVETTSLASLMGHSQTRTLERYVSNTYESHLKAVEMVSERLTQIIGFQRS